MMQEDTTLSTLPSMFQAKAEPQMNSQGEIIAQPQQSEQSQETQQQPAQLPGNYDDVLSLADTELAIPSDSLCDPTDDTGLEHKIISCGHVLKSTHDLARWSEKTGARRVNGIEALDAVTDLAINLEPNTNRGKNNQGSAGGNTNANNNQGSTDASEDISGLFNEGGNNRGRGRRARSNNGDQQWKPVEGEGLKSEVINCWPVLKSTHDQAQLSEKRGRNAVNQADTSGALDELALNQGGQGQGGQQRRGRGQRQGGQQQQQAQQPSAILNSWPVLKSTHDMATLAEKRGANAVNAAGGSQVLEEVIQNTDQQQQGGIQAGGSSLQSGLDTQGGSHVQDSAQ